jgi:hypothetical protein
MNCSSTNSFDSEYAPGVEWTRILYVEKFDFTIHNEFELNFSMALSLFRMDSSSISAWCSYSWTELDGHCVHIFFSQGIVTTGDLSSPYR